MPLARVMAEHFIGVERLMEILSLTEKYKDPIEILTELECAGSREKVRERERGKKAGDDRAFGFLSKGRDYECNGFSNCGIANDIITLFFGY